MPRKLRLIRKTYKMAQLTTPLALPYEYCITHSATRTRSGSILFHFFRHIPLLTPSGINFGHRSRIVSGNLTVQRFNALFRKLKVRHRLAKSQAF
jgi:hypothetical protein